MFGLHCDLRIFHDLYWPIRQLDGRALVLHFDCLREEYAVQRADVLSRLKLWILVRRWEIVTFSWASLLLVNGSLESLRLCECHLVPRRGIWIQELLLGRGLAAILAINEVVDFWWSV